MNWAKVTNQKAGMFLIDFEKAYDRVEWGFLLMMLEAVGFPKVFCQMAYVLLKDASAEVKINDSRSQTISLSRSIRQGCPLARALFVIAIDAMYYFLRESSSSHKVKGITLPNNMDLVTLVMKLTVEKVERFIDEGTVQVYLSELSHGYTWTKFTNERSPFVSVLEACVKEINEVCSFGREKMGLGQARKNQEQLNYPPSRQFSESSYPIVVLKVLESNRSYFKL
ncbi:uncharacterized protein LOC131876266 [Cryptomeria japonica]|uniref:uncharacterized protein LOC131876266 n=1 Tax=Cryptomeria japonica TaxID=3369 RepID=UPI0027DA3E37|nr:uncharacterized protein LOC131876266 [Cryptomeria japonica]